jgi:beta-lactamase regulating signal transducer with metallopeptidase domain
MMTLASYLSPPFMETLGWVLLHFVWQGSLVALCAGGLEIFLRKCAAQVRYVVFGTAMLSMVVFPLVTAIWLYPSSSPSTSIPVTQVISNEFSSMVPSTASSSWEWKTSFKRLEALLPYISLIWLLGVSLLTIHLLGGWIYLQTLRTWGIQQIGTQWQERLQHLMRQLSVKRTIRLLESKRVKVPAVIGWIRPVILLPVGMLVGLTPQQVEAILLHELAHIRRYDYLLNMLQTIMETLFFYHPAVWWISRKIRIEREYCCDDQAVSIQRDPLVYARALTQLEGLRSGTPSLSLSASDGSLFRRIHRVVMTTSPSFQSKGRIMNRFSLNGLGTGLALCIILILGGMMDIRPTHSEANGTIGTPQVPTAKIFIKEYGDDMVRIDAKEMILNGETWTSRNTRKGGISDMELGDELAKFRDQLGDDMRLTILVSAKSEIPILEQVKLATRQAGIEEVDVVFSKMPETLTKAPYEVTFDVPQKGKVTAEVFDVMGQRVATLLDGPLASGKHQVSWKGLKTDGKEAAPGIYFLKLQADGLNLMYKVVHTLEGTTEP